MSQRYRSAAPRDSQPRESRGAVPVRGDRGLRDHPARSACRVGEGAEARGAESSAIVPRGIPLSHLISLMRRCLALGVSGRLSREVSVLDLALV
jgi:hypothetical protein